MPRVAIVTDSSADLPEPLRAAAGVVVVPVDIPAADAVLAEPDAAAAARFAAAFARLGADRAAIVAVCASGRLSGAVALAARAAAASPVPVEVVDSRSASMGLGFQALRAAELAAAGSSAPAIADRLRAETDRYPVLFALDALDFLEQGGRVGRAASLIGGMLQLKPLLWLDEGQVVPLERTRTRQRAMDELADFVRELPTVDRVAVLHASEPEAAADLAGRIAAATGFPRAEIVQARIGPLIAARTGPGALGVAVQTGI
ncbi:MAG TPA: DegV family protein [Thermomicrobiales bacterium]|nr:DegV family protein [Thermomicrobiales bacterium]